MKIEIYGEEERCPDLGFLSLPSSHETVGMLAHMKKKERGGPDTILAIRGAAFKTADSTPN